MLNQHISGFIAYCKVSGFKAKSHLFSISNPISIPIWIWIIPTRVIQWNSRITHAFGSIHPFSLYLCIIQILSQWCSSQDSQEIGILI
jgi:hypothetical protein